MSNEGFERQVRPMTVQAVGFETDEHLMRRVQGNDPGAFELLYERHGTRALRVALGVCHDRGRAEDAVQEAFLGMWRARMNYRPEAGSVRTWAMQIVRHRAIDSVRREGVRPPLAEEGREIADPAHVSVPGDLIARDEANAVRASVMLLPAAQAEAITLSYFGHMTHVQIAQRLSVASGTVKGRLRLGLEKLRQEMSPLS